MINKIKYLTMFRKELKRFKGYKWNFHTSPVSNYLHITARIGNKTIERLVVARNERLKDNVNDWLRSRIC